MISRVGVLAHPRRPESIPVAREVAGIAKDSELETWLGEAWTPEQVRESVPGTDFLVAIGGDGAMLQAGRLGAPYGVPVFGLNMGYLGFLSEAGPDKWASSLERILAGEFWLERRLMLTGEVWREGKCLVRADALNDIVVSRSAEAKAIRLDAFIDDAWVTTYNADGLIIATATGSTAYALAVGGPILPPELDNILMLPVAPHFSMERPIILSEGVTVKVVVSQFTQTEIVVSIDGQKTLPLKINDEVIVRASSDRSLFMRLKGRNYFFRSLMDRMEPRFLPHHPENDLDDYPKKD